MADVVFEIVFDAIFAALEGIFRALWWLARRTVSDTAWLVQYSHARWQRFHLLRVRNRERRRLKRDSADIFGCEYCAEDDNRYYEHVVRIAFDGERGAILQRCPECGSLYEQDTLGQHTRRLTEIQAKDRFPGEWDLNGLAVNPESDT